jgi:hypothetical protein
MTRWILIALLALGLASFGGMIGCHAEVDDDGADVKIGD